MKKLVVVLVALAALSFAAAQDFTVGAEYGSALGVTAEFAQPVDGFGALLLGVSVDPTAFATEVSFGVRVPAFTLEGEDVAVFSVPVLVHLPVYDGADFILGQLDVSIGLEMFVPSQTSNFGLVFDVAGRTPVNADALTQLPSLVLGGGLRYAF